jgi:DNA-binding response OmpR family regulator
MSNGQTKILLIEDESVVRMGLHDNLVFEGYKVICCPDGKTGLETFKQENPDLVILDVMMPGVDGLEVCKQIRAQGRSTPVIMLTAKCGEIDKVLGLELGADDYLTKPFGMRELVARVKALLRRAKMINSALKKDDQDNDAISEIKFDNVTIDFRSYQARKGSQDLILSAKEFELLRYLTSRPDVPVTRDQLLDQVWGYNSYPTTRTVDNFIARLRQKLEIIPDKPKRLITVHGVGYKFVSST